ncbi:MAG: EAL domain-containing protein [Burkholderiaceae bacterium]
MRLHPSHRPDAIRYLAILGGLFVVLVIVASLPLLGSMPQIPAYIYIHAALEMIAIAIAAMIFGIGYNIPKDRAPCIACWLGSAFLGVALLDFSHTMGFPGMPGLLQPGNIETGIAFWFAARTLALAAMLAAALASWERTECRYRKSMLAGTLLVVTACHIVFFGFPELLPETFSPQTGLTPFKIAYEYALMAGYAVAALLCAVRLKETRRVNLSAFFAACATMAMSEYFFTLYSSITDIYHLAGHLYKVIAYLFLYQALFTETVHAPYQDIKASREQLQQALDRLSQAMRERQELDDRLSKLSLAIEQNPNPVLITSRDGRIEYVNQAFIDSSGYSQNEILGKNPRFLRSGKTPMSTYQSMWAALSQGKLWKGEVINQRKNGQEFTERLLIFPIKDASGAVTHFLSHKEDLTEHKAAAEHIRRLSQYDTLTGLANQASMRVALRHTIDLAQHHRDPFAVMSVNLDNFRFINESLGHLVGDQVLVGTAGRLSALVNDRDVLARISGDLFVLVFPGMDQRGATLKASEIVQAMQQPLIVENHTLIATVSIGVSLYPDDGTHSETLLTSSEAAMYYAKAEGKNNFRFFAPGQQQSSTRMLALGAALQQAAQRDELRLVFQPQLNLHTGRIDGAEALVRWRHPQLGEIGPAEFIPLAENYGLIAEIGEWILRKALKQTRAWQDAGLPGLTVAINLSATQFNQPDLARTILGIVQETGADPATLELELTEAVAMRDPVAAGKVLTSLAEQGFRISIDDFGTGYSSLSYLKRFNIDKLKIDRSFISDLTSSTNDQAIVTAIIQMAHGLGMRTIAEGVETSEQLAVLKDKGCDAIQGYWCSKPLSPDQFEAFVRAHHG